MESRGRKELWRRRWAAGAGLIVLSACYRAHEPETGIPVTVLAAELNILQLPRREPEPAVGALVRAERCVDGAVVEATVKADGRAWIDYGDDLDVDCWTVTAVWLEGRPTALTLVRVEAPLPFAHLARSDALARPPPAIGDARGLDRLTQRA